MHRILSFFFFFNPQQLQKNEKILKTMRVDCRSQFLVINNLEISFYGTSQDKRWKRKRIWCKVTKQLTKSSLLRFKRSINHKQDCRAIIIKRRASRFHSIKMIYLNCVPHNNVISIQFKWKRTFRPIYHSQEQLFESYFICNSNFCLILWFDKNDGIHAIICLAFIT